MKKIFESLGNDLRGLILEEESLDRDDNWLYLNTLWYKPKPRKIYSSILVEFIEGTTGLPERQVILALDGAASTHGITPVVSAVADKLRSKLVIWKESFPVSVSESWILPPRVEKNKECIIVQDVFSNGSSLPRVAEDINYLEWKVNKIYSLVWVDRNEERFYENLEMFKNMVNCGDAFEALCLLNLSDI